MDATHPVTGMSFPVDLLPKNMYYTQTGETIMKFEMIFIVMAVFIVGHGCKEEIKSEERPRKKIPTAPIKKLVMAPVTMQQKAMMPAKPSMGILMTSPPSNTSKNVVFSKELKNAVHHSRCPSALGYTDLTNFFCFPFLNIEVDRRYSEKTKYTASERILFLKEIRKKLPNINYYSALFITPDLASYPQLFSAEHIVFPPKLKKWRSVVNNYFLKAASIKAYLWKKATMWGSSRNSAFFSFTNMVVAMQNLRKVTDKDYRALYEPHTQLSMVSYKGPVQVIVGKKLPTYHPNDTLRIDTVVRFPVSKELDLVLAASKGRGSSKIEMDMDVFKNVKPIKDIYEVVFPLLNLTGRTVIRHMHKGEKKMRKAALSKRKFHGFKEYEFHKSIISFKLVGDKVRVEEKNYKKLLFQTNFRFYLIWRRHDIVLTDGSIQTSGKSYSRDI
jgi:hypothetical protein